METSLDYENQRNNLHNQSIARQQATDNEFEQKRAGMLHQNADYLSQSRQNQTPLVLPHFSDSDFSYFTHPQADSGGGSVICTKFYKMGMCEKEIYHCEHKWGGWLAKNDPFVMRGYYLWGIPLAKMLNKKTKIGRCFIKIVHPIFHACSLETAAQQGVYRPRSWLTKMTGKFFIATLLTRFNRTLGKIHYTLTKGKRNVAGA